MSEIVECIGRRFCLFVIDIVYYLILCSPTYDDINHFFQQLHITGHTYFYTSHDRGDWWENGSDKIVLI